MASKASAALRHSRLGARRRLVNPTQASKERIGDKEAFEVPGSAGRRIFSGIPLRQGALGMLGQLHSNTVFMCGLLAWTIAQILKLFTTYFATGTWRWKVLFDSGGMPSSHASLVLAVTTSIGIFHGVSSTAFAMSLCFSLIVMYDAAGVRRHAGLQAQVLNQVMSGMDGYEERLKEVLGHTPLQVAMGALLGFISSLWYCKFIRAL